ncbi:hypothetical protein DID77_04320 [Candidatus Marinamargulisbacteria bacterium SCGC AG-439-L15]|nr:hypothetical protein DID77_04320 [Candidatus Marinamargulisbacteria bacterium SCGC AG-439-L15]
MAIFNNFQTKEVLQSIVAPTLDVFKKDYLHAHKPALFTDIVPHWKAYHDWDNDYLKKEVGDVVVSVEQFKNGWSVNKENCTEKTMPLSEYIDLIHSESPESKNSYLAQQSILEKIPRLADDIGVLDYFEGHLPLVNLYFGPKGSRTPLHFDYVPNLYAQIRGKKRLIIFPPGRYTQYYPNPHPKLGHFSQVDPLNIETAKYRSFPSDKAIDVTLEPGDMLYLPSLWWHDVQGLEPNISLSYWWMPKKPLSIAYKHLKLKCVKSIYQVNHRLWHSGPKVKIF